MIMKTDVNQVYQVLTGPLLWISFIIFGAGLIIRTIYLIHLSRKKDRVVYNHINLKWGIKSILHWIIPLASASMRLQPVFTLMAFAFHISLLAVPLFLSAHNILWDESIGLTLWSMPDIMADLLTVIMIGSGIFLLIRRVVRAEIRILTEARDYAFLLLTMLPFLTGFLALHQWGPYQILLILHILSAEVLLILIPFSKLGHMVLFFFTRAFIGFEMGARRGARSW
jgi:nitrate reductase gamma subunit